MQTHPISRHWAWIPVIAGLAWLASGADAGWLSYLLAAGPGSLLVASGVAAALWPGDPRPLQVGSLSAAGSVLLGIISFTWASPLVALALIGLSLAAFVTLGALSLAQEIPTQEIPVEQRSLGLATAVAIDEALLGVVVPLALRRRTEGILHEGQVALDFFGEQGWLEKPESYHQTPPALEQPRLDRARVMGIHFEHLQFDSGYAPHPREPGGARWGSYEPCRTAHAWVLRHASPERPWLVCIHGLQMGWPRIDFTAFRAQRLHQRLGLNLLFPVLPFHGPRGHGRISGNGFLSEQFLDTVHAFAQSAWDLRRMLSWIRGQGATKIGVHGLSLGGYTTALLASLEEGLACAIPGVPAVDFSALAWRHAPPHELRRFEREGLGRDALEQLMRPVAPLALRPKVPRERRYLFGGRADRLVPPEQVRALWSHWEEPSIHWYPGSHVSFLLHPGVRRFVDDSLRESGLTA